MSRKDVKKKVFSPRIEVKLNAVDAFKAISEILKNDFDQDKEMTIGEIVRNIDLMIDRMTTDIAEGVNDE